MPAAHWPLVLGVEEQFTAFALVEDAATGALLAAMANGYLDINPAGVSHITQTPWLPADDTDPRTVIQVQNLRGMHVWNDQQQCDADLVRLPSAVEVPAWLKTLQLPRPVTITIHRGLPEDIQAIWDARFGK